MNPLSAPLPSRKRRRFSPEFKARIVAASRQPGVSVSRLALDNDLNANMLRRWIREAERAGAEAAPAFVPVRLPALGAESPPVAGGGPIRITLPRVGGAVVIEWPTDQAPQCVALLRALLA